jgi:raffinose/stachyose/melibiose transport system permease protein
MRQTTMLALDIYDTFYGRTGFQGVGQAKAVIFFLIVGLIAYVQLRVSRSREVEG